MLTAIGMFARWTARAITVVIAGVFVVFLAGEPAGSLRAINFREWVGMFLLLAVIAAMLAAWRWELLGALVSLGALASFALVIHMRGYDVLIGLAIPGALFLIDWEMRRLKWKHVHH